MSMKLYYLIKINLKSYFLKFSNLLTLFFVPYFLFLLFKMNDNYDPSNLYTNYHYLAGTITLVVILLGLNLFSKYISMDKTFKRIKLLRANGINKYFHFLAMLIPIGGALVISLFVISLFGLMLNINLFSSFIPLLVFTFVGILSLSGIGYLIGLKSRDIISTNGYSNLISSLLILLGSLYQPLSNISIPIISKVVWLSPIYHLKNILYHIISKENNYTSTSIIFLIVMVLFSLLIFRLTKWKD